MLCLKQGLLTEAFLQHILSCRSLLNALSVRDDLNFLPFSMFMSCLEAQEMTTLDGRWKNMISDLGCRHTDLWVKNIGSKASFCFLTQENIELHMLTWKCAFSQCWLGKWETVKQRMSGSPNINLLQGFNPVIHSYKEISNFLYIWHIYGIFHISNFFVWVNINFIAYIFSNHHICILCLPE